MPFPWFAIMPGVRIPPPAAAYPRPVHNVPPVTSTSNATQGPYPIEGVGLGDILPKSKIFSSLKCLSSDTFQYSKWCLYNPQKQDRIGRRYDETIAFLYSLNGTVDYSAKVIEPAYFERNDFEDEIARLSRAYHQQAHVTTIPYRQGLPNAVIATWGSVDLVPLDSSDLQSFANGLSPKVGFIVDFLGDFKRSAQEGLPIFVLSGGAGMIWSASSDENGKGKLRFSAIDATKLTLISGPKVAAQTEPDRDPAAAAAPPSPAGPPLQKFSETAVTTSATGDSVTQSVAAPAPVSEASQGASMPVASSTGGECSKLTDPVQRLDCYDKTAVELRPSAARSEERPKTSHLMPAAEKMVIEAVERPRHDYGSASNEMQQGGARGVRAKTICSAIGNRSTASCATPFAGIARLNLSISYRKI
ncbi:MAG TPA: hypothetical protein VGG86_12230 [Roseiarcus sp.]